MDVAAEDDELVAGEPAHDVAGPHCGLEALCEREEDLVAAGVPERVVDQLEVVEVDEEDREIGALLHRDEQFAFELVVEQGAVAEAGERVVVGEPVELGLCGLAVRDVGERADHHRRVVLPGAGQEPRAEREPLAPTVPVGHADDHVVLGVAGRRGLHVGEHLRRQRVAVGVDGDGSPGEDLVAVARGETFAEDPAGRFVVRGDLARLVEEHDALAQRRHDRLVALLRRAAACFRLARIGELGADHDPTRRLGVVVDEGVDRHHHVDRRPVLSAVTALPPLEHRRAVGPVGGDHRGDGVADHLLLRPPVDRFGRLVPTLDLAVGVDTDDRVGHVGDEARPVAVGSFGRSTLRDVAHDDLEGRSAAPAGPDARDLHDGDTPVEGDDAGFAVFEELAVLGELRDAVEGADDVARVHEVGDRSPVVLFHRPRAHQPDRSSVAVDEPAVLVDDHDVGGDLGEEPVTVDQIPELALELLLGGHVDHHAGVEVLVGGEGLVQMVVERGHRGRPDHHAVLEPVGSDDHRFQVEVSRWRTQPERGEDRGEQRFGEDLTAGVAALFVVGVVDSGDVVPHPEAADAGLEPEEDLDRVGPEHGVGGLVVDPRDRLEALGGEIDVRRDLDGLTCEVGGAPLDLVEGDAAASAVGASRASHRLRYRRPSRESLACGQVRQQVRAEGPEVALSPPVRPARRPN